MDELPASDLSTTTVLDEQFDSNFNQSINGTSSAIKNPFQISSETLRLFYIAIAIIVILICLTIFIYICLRRRCKSKKHPENKDQLLPEQSKKSSKIPTHNSITVNRAAGSTNPPTNSNSKTPINSFYYDNLDDIPFIDESRPTSVVDMTQV